MFCFLSSLQGDASRTHRAVLVGALLGRRVAGARAGLVPPLVAEGVAVRGYGAEGEERERGREVRLDGEVDTNEGVGGRRREGEEGEDGEEREEGRSGGGHGGW